MRVGSAFSFLIKLVGVQKKFVDSLVIATVSVHVIKQSTDLLKKSLFRFLGMSLVVGSAMEMEIWLS